MNPTFLAARTTFLVGFFFGALIYAIIFVLYKPNTKTPTRKYLALSSITYDESSSLEPSLIRISMNEVFVATRNFTSDGIIGDGNFGLVCKARLSTGVHVAVKRFIRDAFQGVCEFRAEVVTLGQIRHQNLVKLLAYCMSGDDQILIYEFLEKGSLDEWLHDTSSQANASISSSSSMGLSWDTRIKISKGVGLGLSYLHTLETPIIHRDIQSCNVLLNSEFEAFISHFRFARIIKALHTHASTQPAGTIGYMPPEYYKNGVTKATPYGDVYSFGVLMFEVAMGRRPTWPILMEDGKYVGLVEWARKMVAQKRHVEMIDSSVSREGLRKAEAREFLRIACLCTSEEYRDRPSMGQVATLLNQL